MSPLWFMAFIAFGVLAGWLLMELIYWLSTTYIIRRVNAWVEVDQGTGSCWTEQTLRGGSLTWTGGRR